MYEFKKICGLVGHCVEPWAEQESDKVKVKPSSVSMDLIAYGRQPTETVGDPEKENIIAAPGRDTNLCYGCAHACVHVGEARGWGLHGIVSRRKNA